MISQNITPFLIVCLDSKQPLSNPLSDATPARARGGGQGGDEALVEAEELFDAVAVASKGSGTVEFVDGAVEFLMRLAQLVRHDVNVVEVGEGLSWETRHVRRARIGQACESLRAVRQLFRAMFVCSPHP